MERPRTLARLSMSVCETISEAIHMLKLFRFRVEINKRKIFEKTNGKKREENGPAELGDVGKDVRTADLFVLFGPALTEKLTRPNGTEEEKEGQKKKKNRKRIEEELTNRKRFWSRMVIWRASSLGVRESILSFFHSIMRTALVTLILGGLSSSEGWNSGRQGREQDSILLSMWSEIDLDAAVMCLATSVDRNSRNLSNNNGSEWMTLGCRSANNLITFVILFFFRSGE